MTSPSLHKSATTSFLPTQFVITVVNQAMATLSSTINSPSLPESKLCSINHLKNGRGGQLCIDLLQQIKAMRHLEDKYYCPPGKQLVANSAPFPTIDTIIEGTSNLMESVSSFGSNNLPSKVHPPSEEKNLSPYSPASDNIKGFVRTITNDSSCSDCEEEDDSSPQIHVSTSSSTSCANVSRWRPKIGQWMYKVLDYYRISRELVSVAMSYLDRAVVATLRDGGKTSSGGNAPTCLSLRWYQCASMVCLALATKVYAESDSDAIPLNTMILLGRGHISKIQLKEMENYVLWTLLWHVHPPTSHGFIRSFSSLLPDTLLSEENVDVKEEVIRMSYFLTELSVLDEEMFMSYEASTISLASVWLSLYTYNIAVTVWEEMYLLVSNHADVDIDPDEMDGVCDALELLAS